MACKDTKNIRVDYNNMMADYIGEKEGINKSDISKVMPLVTKAYKEVISNKGKDMMGWTSLPYEQDEICDDIIKTAKEVNSWAESFVVLGIGGSALGPMAVFQSLAHLRHNDLPKNKRNAPKFYVEDNIDPERMASLLDVIDLKTTCFNIITKSGATSETMSQYLIILNLLKKNNLDISKHIIATTDHKKGNLIKIAKEYNLKTFYIEDGVGGRFSELSPVGLLPAAILNIDIKEILRGAKTMDEMCSKENFEENPALVSATLQYIAINKGKNISVMMPYADSLKLVADWYCQIWAESLGKSKTNDGKIKYQGQTPVKSLGVTDQHSQVQLYTEGPFDKVVTFIAVNEFRVVTNIPHGQEDIADVSFLGGHTLNELITKEYKATEYALTKANRMNYTIVLPCVSANTIGQLLYLFEMQTAFAGAMMNLNTYNQPGVEEGKNATYALLGKSGYDEKREELNLAKKKVCEFVVK